MFLAVFGFLFGIFGMVYLSPKVTNYSIKLGHVFRVSPLIIGLMIAVGANLPEFSNSVISSFLGFDNVNIGNLLGSSLALVSLSTGAVILFRGGFNVDRKNILILCACMTIVLFQIFTIFENGLISRINGFILVGNFILIYFIIHNSIIKKEYIFPPQDKIFFSQMKYKYFFYIILSLLGIVLSAYVFVNSVVSLSDFFGISSFVVSFFVVSIATTLPEFFIGIDAVKKGEYELFFGDQFGGVISNLTLILGVSAIISAKVIDSAVVIASLNYLILAVVLVFLIILINKKIDRKTALLMILIYLGSFFFVK
ncbi:MAG: hypothetical protein PHT91_01405 [Candidatus Nanoarchaeia archaeon]|nr:hypothetical protein [Candidatus Nanoarchaeia archaeon]MDD5053824.1 hypothetical protein [Candidatus Nanoarchaeia archaeon]MDD5499513.1 hypothetical protein [Candidatus Nanoarchaeia archaeon]